MSRFWRCLALNLLVLLALFDVAIFAMIHAN